MYTIGIDESGTGAWAGPFTVCGCVLLDDVQGLRDSKKLSETKRIQLTAELLDPTTSILYIESISPEGIAAQGQQLCWENAIIRVVERMIMKLTSQTSSRSFEVVVDGLGSRRLWQKLPRVRFEAKADDKYPAVSAASIVAKTERNSQMRNLHKLYPQYGFDEHFGYGVPAHIEALKQYGRCPQHRKIRGRT